MTLQIHKWVGLFMLAAFGVHIISVLVHIEWRRFPGSIYGPDSLLPRFADAPQALQHLDGLHHLLVTEFPHAEPLRKAEVVGDEHGNEEVTEP